MATLPRAARKHHRLSALLARRAVAQARQQRPSGGTAAVVGVIVAHQMTSAQESESAVGQILAELAFAPSPAGRIRLPAFTTPPDSVARMVESTNTDLEFDRLVASLVQEAGNAAEQVASAVREEVGWTRMLTPPSCSRCVPLAGRVYRWSDGFLRHPQDDCVTIPVREGDARFTVDPAEMVRRGEVRGLSKADTEAILDGADYNAVVNVRRKAAGLTEAGTVLARRGRPTPAGIYRMARDREHAIELLGRFGYLL